MWTVAYLDDENITRNEITGRDFLFLTISDDSCFECDISLKFSDDITSLLFLIPSNKGVEEQDSDNDTEIDPILKTSCENDCEFHCIQNWALEECEEFEEEVLVRTGV